MYAQVIQGGAAPAQRDAMDAIVHEQMIPALGDEPGFTGALNLVDRDTGNAMMVVIWQEEEQARRPLPEYGRKFLQALASIAAISSGNRAPISVWDVNANTAAARRRPPGPGVSHPPGRGLAALPAAPDGGKLSL